MAGNPRRLARGISIAVLALVSVPLPGAARAYNWADDGSALELEPSFAETQQVCRDLKRLPVPEADRPDAEQAKALDDCDAGRLYYGIGIPAAPERARDCAYVQREHDSKRYFSGSRLLMTIYANGVGAERDFDLATKFACEFQGAPAEMAGRVTHLQALKAQHWQGHDFSYCDDITSGQAGGACAGLESAIANAARSEVLAQLTADWSEAEQQAFEPLRVAKQAYIDASVDNEVDLTGTARVAFMHEHEQHLEKTFLALLEKLETGDPPDEDAQAFRVADARLNAVYQQIMAIETPPSERGPYGSEDSLPWITVTKHGIRVTQRAWLEYRDAWTAFAAIRYPQLDGDRLNFLLTRQRTAALRDFTP